MNIRNARVLHGPNVWAACPVLEVSLDLNDLGSANDVRPRLARFAKDLFDGDPSPGELPVAFAHTLMAGVRRLQEIAGTPVAFIAAKPTAGARDALAAVEFASAPLAQEALDVAWRLLQSTSDDPVRPSADDVKRLKDLEYKQRIPPTVATTYFGAKKRGVPVSKLSAEYSGYIVLGHGSKQRRVRWSEPDAVSGVARLASTDKYLTNQLLESIGVPVPKGRLVGTAEEAWAAAEALGMPVAVKPYNCDLQTGVSLDLRSREKVEAAFHGAIEHSSWVLVERFAPGVEHRVVVVGERVVAVTRIEPPHVDGDGVSTIAQLVETTNQDPRRSGDDRSEAPLSKLKIDDVALAVIASQGFNMDSVPPEGRRVLVRRDPPYFKNGGTLTDLTDVIHPTTAAHAVAASHMMQIPVAGLDVVAVDIAKPLEEQEGVIVEINANPGFWLHLAPWADSPRPVGEEMAAWLFPDGNDGRIPVAALVGDADGAVARCLRGILTQAGLRVGCAGPTELSAGDRRWPAPKTSPQDRAYRLFRNPAVDAALFETDAEELREHGFATDRCDVAVIGASAPHEGDWVRALTNALSPTGVFVVTSPLVGVDASRAILVTDDSSRDAHLHVGGQAVFVRGNDVVHIRGTGPSSILGPATGLVTADVLLGVAAAWSLGQPAESITAYLRALS